MSNRQGKCPGCGLVNWPDAFECRCCGVALRAQARAVPSYKTRAPLARAVKGWVRRLLYLFVLLMMVGAGLRHARLQKPEEEARPAEAAESSDAKQDKRSGPPSLSEPRRRVDDGSEGGETAADVLRMGAERKAEFNRLIEDHERSVYGDENSRGQARASRRGLSGPSPGQPPAHGRPISDELREFGRRPNRR